MMRRLLALLGAAALTLTATFSAQARDNGQWPGLTLEQQLWFRHMRSNQGVPCCDVADGYRATYRDDHHGGYEVLINGLWLSVPTEAIILNSENPTGDAVVWFSHPGPDSYHIRCFVLGPEG